jgi:hypothetical protein
MRNPILFDRLVCPRTKSPLFGHIQTLVLDGREYQQSPIYLFAGRHTGANRGFGAIHIWEEHKREMAKIGLHSYEEVPYFVESIVRPNTAVHFEGGGFRATRLIAVRNSIGTAILEWREMREGTIWSVVTAYLTPRASGKLVGRIM